jgi:hypothetical protein
MKRSKVFAFPFQYLRPIPRPASPSHNQRMDLLTKIDALETAREIDDLNLTIKNLRSQLDFQHQQNRVLRVRTARYEAILGMEEAA